MLEARHTPKKPYRDLDAKTGISPWKSILRTSNLLRTPIVPRDLRKHDAFLIKHSGYATHDCLSRAGATVSTCECIFEAEALEGEAGVHSMDCPRMTLMMRSRALLLGKSRAADASCTVDAARRSRDTGKPE
jgi:hypothetical protein